jgi:Peptidase family C25
MGIDRMLFPLLWIVLGVLPSDTPDTLVVCPSEFRAALAPWVDYRGAQGHVIAVVEPPTSAAELRKQIVRVARSGRLKYVVLVGDVAGNGEERGARSEELPGVGREQRAAGEKSNGERGSPLPGVRPSPTVPTCYVEARVNIRWGSEPTIATDEPYADIDGDRLPDVAVGRIPVDTPEELASCVRKVLRYEQQADQGMWRRRINVVAGVGGFGQVTDAMIEAAARSVIVQFVPESYEVGQTIANPSSPFCPPPERFTADICHQLSDGCFIWMYLGHGLPTMLDVIATPSGPQPMMSVEDVADVNCGANNPLAVLVACYTGAFDASEDCLGERLAISEHGPVAVVGATRVTMPYGNTVFGCELLRACFTDRPTTLGELWTLAERRAIATAPGDPLRLALDAMASGISPPPVDLEAERQEHVMLYQLLGDPLMRLEYPAGVDLKATTTDDGSKLSVEGTSDVSGRCRVELVSSGAEAQVRRPDVVTVNCESRGGAFRCTIPLPKNAAGSYRVRAFVAGGQAFAIGATPIDIRQRETHVASVPESAARK